MLPQLKLAADSLLARLSVLGSLPPPTSTPEDWKGLIDLYEGAFPSDYVELITQYPFENVELEYTCLNQVREYPKYLDTIFRFRGPGPECKNPLPDALDGELKKLGWAPIAEGENGDFWSVRLATGLAGPVYLVSHTAWGPGPPTFKNGLTYAAPSLAHLMVGFALPDIRFGEWDRQKGKHLFELRADLFSPEPDNSEVYDFSKEGTTAAQLP